MRTRGFQRRAVPIFLAFAFSCSSGPTPEQARAKIEAAQVPFDASGLIEAVGSGNNELLQLFLVAGIDPEMRDGSKPAPLELAAARANLPAVKLLVEAGADPAKLPGVLNVPAARGDVAVLAALIDAGADVESIDHLRQTAVMAAASRVNLAGVAYLLERGADPDGRPGRGQRPLLTAIKQDAPEMVRALVEAGADVDGIGGTPHTTPLILAAQLGQLETVEYLLERGADPAKGVSGQTALRAARRAGHDEVARRLEAALAN